MTTLFKVSMATALVLIGFAFGCFFTYITSFYSLSADLESKLRFHQILASENIEAQEKELIALYKVQIPYLTCQTYEFYRSGISQLGLGSELDKQILDKGFATLGVDIHKEELKASYCKDRSLPVI